MIVRIFSPRKAKPDSDYDMDDSDNDSMAFSGDKQGKPLYTHFQGLGPWKTMRPSRWLGEGLSAILTCKERKAP